MGDTESLNVCRQYFFYIYIYFFYNTYFYQVSSVTCFVSPVTCRMSLMPTSTAKGPPSANSSSSNKTMQLLILTQTQTKKIHMGIFDHLRAKLLIFITFPYFLLLVFLLFTFVNWSNKTLKKHLVFFKKIPFFLSLKVLFFFNQ